VFRSLDGGATFAPAGSGLTGAGVMGLGIDPRNPARLYAWMHDGGLFRSDDRAVTWRAVDTGESARRSGLSAGRGDLAIDPRHSGHVFLGTAASSKSTWAPTEPCAGRAAEASSPRAAC